MSDSNKSMQDRDREREREREREMQTKITIAIQSYTLHREARMDVSPDDGREKQHALVDDEKKSDVVVH